VIGDGHIPRLCGPLCRHAGASVFNGPVWFGFILKSFSKKVFGYADSRCLDTQILRLQIMIQKRKHI
jgi:hypothetical protein